MIRKQKIEQLTEWRNPTEEEKEKIGKYYECYFDSLIRVGNSASSILTVLGIVLCMSNEGIFLKVVGIILFLIVFKLIWDKNDSKRTKRLLQTGKFQVMYGQVYQTFPHEDSPGTCYIKATSENGEKMDTTFMVREEGVHMGTQVLIVYITPDLVKGGFLRALTPYMLTDEGRKHKI